VVYRAFRCVEEPVEIRSSSTLRLAALPPFYLGGALTYFVSCFFSIVTVFAHGLSSVRTPLSFFVLLTTILLFVFVSGSCHALSA
jgi:hypothetical protein